MTDADDADTIAVDVIERSADGGGVLAVEHSLLDAASDPSDFHEEVVFKCGVVGVEADVDVHCATSIQHQSWFVNGYFRKSLKSFVATKPKLLVLGLSRMIIVPR